MQDGQKIVGNPEVGHQRASRPRSRLLARWFRASEGTFGVDVPVVSEQGSYPGGEGFGVSERFQVAMEAKLALPEVALQSGNRLAAKDAPEHPDRKKEARAGWNQRE